MEKSNFKFLGYRVSKVECAIEDNYGQTGEKLSQDIEIVNNLSEHDKRFVEIVFNLSLKTESESFKFFIQIKGGFQADPEMDEELFKILYLQNAPAILYPFARSIVTTYTAQANIPPIILPSMNFQRKK